MRCRDLPLPVDAESLASGLASESRWSHESVSSLGHGDAHDAVSRASGEGYVYQGRFKSFPIQDDGHFFTVCRYVETNALRAEFVKRAKAWRWGSLWRWLQSAEPKPTLLSPWPTPRLSNWVERVNEPLTKSELDAVRRLRLGRIDQQNES